MIDVSSRHIGVAAEAAAAALFARAGFDVSVQYGANQPEYDLIVARPLVPGGSDRSGDILKVSVKGSKDGAWGLTQSLIRNADYHGAADAWLRRHGTRTVFCLVQYKDVPVEAMPRVYLAWPTEIAARLKQAANGRGDTILHERHTWGSRAHAAGSIDEVPAAWRFSIERIESLLLVPET
ncbi:MAG: hypothetical protein CL858_26710 [Cupriavidus sp.]|uniref:hypothetical protein n=1 Tax=Cupriavidus pauculus TaxID=82633 RepID=UPI0005729167|nr:hypothetical protein [Cupriavidus pauculus]MBU68991.1 hypothetical protein [Cupriavidus sp.]